MWQALYGVAVDIDPRRPDYPGGRPNISRKLAERAVHADGRDGDDVWRLG